MSCYRNTDKREKVQNRLVDQHTIIFIPHNEHFLFFFYLFPSQGFKWFGSLTNLTFRRSAEKSDSKTSKSGAGGAAGGGPATTATLAPVVETVDDMGAMRPRTTSYVRSSENYTHLGTLPRLLMKRRDKNNKGIGASLQWVGTFPLSLVKEIEHFFTMTNLLPLLFPLCFHFYS